MMVTDTGKSAQVKQFRHKDETYLKTVFGFWVYLMTDCILFATLFATYAVLHQSTSGGPTAKELFSLPFALAETLILLTSSFTCGLAALATQRFEKNNVMIWTCLTFILGLAFLMLELKEFNEFIEQGNSWQRSGFLSAFFTLAGTHGTHITFGLIWMIVLLYQIFQRGITNAFFRRMTCFTLFWHFLDIIWVFIFTFVYLLGAR